MTEIMNTQIETPEKSVEVIYTSTGRHYATATTQEQPRATSRTDVKRRGQRKKSREVIVRPAPELPAAPPRAWIDQDGDIRIWSAEPTLDEFESFLRRKDELHPLSEFWTEANVAAAARKGDAFCKWVRNNTAKPEPEDGSDPMDILHDAKKFYAQSGDSWGLHGLFSIPGGNPGATTVRRDAYVPRHAPGVAPTSDEFVGRPVQFEVAYLVDLIRKDPADITELPRSERPAWRERKDRLGCLISELVGHHCRINRGEWYYLDVVSEVQVKFFEWVESGDNRPADKILSMLTGIISEAAQKVENSAVRRIDLADNRAIAEVNRASKALADAAPAFQRANDVEVAEMASEMSRRADRSKAPKRELVLAVLRGEVEDDAISKAANKVGPGIAETYRFAAALRVVRSESERTETLKQQQEMIADAVITEICKRDSKPTISREKALSIQQAQGILSIDHTEAGHGADSEDADYDPNSVLADAGKKPEGNKLSPKQYDRLGAAIDSLGVPRQEAETLTLRVKRDLGISNVEWIDDRSGQVQAYNTRLQDVAWSMYGEAPETSEELALRWGVDPSAIRHQRKTVEKKISRFFEKVEAGEIEIVYSPADPQPEGSWMVERDDDEIREMRRLGSWWSREHAKAEQASLYRVDASEAFSGDLRELFEATRLGRVTLREFCGWLQVQGYEAWMFSSAPQMFDQTRREYLDDSRSPAVTRSEDTEREKAWQLFEGWFRRL